MSQFDIEVALSNDPAKAVLRLIGSLDAYVLPHLEKRLHALVREEKKIRIVIDCGRLKFVSSPGLGLFLGMLSELERRGGKLLFSRVIQPEVNEAMDCLGFFDVFKVYASEEEAFRDLDD